MKKFLAVLLVLAVACSLVTVAVAEGPATSGTCGDNATWAFDSTTGTLAISGSGAMADFTEYSQRGGTEDTRPWKDCIKNITHVEIETGITRVGNLAFSGASNLASLSLPEGLQTIGVGAFGVTKLSSVSIPSSVTTLEESAFQENYSLTTVILPAGLKSTGAYVFGGCNKIESLTLPENIESFGTSMFYGCASLKSMVLPACITSIPSATFVNCTSLTSVIFEGDITSIGNSAFSGCSKLDLDIPATVTSIGYGAFSGTAVDSVTIPNGVSLDHSTFKNCTNLTSVKFAGQAGFKDHTGNYGTFSGCTGLTSISLPEGVTIIEKCTFDGCTSLKNLYIPSSVTTLDQSALGSSGLGNETYYVGSSSLVSTISTYYRNKSISLDGVTFIITNGVPADFIETGFAAVSKLGHTAKWYEYVENDSDYSDNTPVTTAPVAGKTYIVMWEKSKYTVPVTLELDAFTEGATPVGKELPITLNDGATDGAGELTAVSDSPAAITAAVADGKVTVTAASGLTAGNYGAVVTVTTLDGAVHEVTVTLTVTKRTSGTTPSTNNTIQSPKTFDAGVALYGVMALASACGAVYVTKKH